MKYLILAIAMTLAGCATNKPNVTQQVEYACAGVTSAVQVLTVASNNHKLSSTDVLDVNRALGVTTPICSAQETPTMDTLKMQTFMQAVSLLENKAREVK